MIDVSGIRIQLKDAGDSHETLMHASRAALIRRLHLASDELTSLELRRRSIDARHRGRIQLILTVRITLRGGAHAERSLLARLKRHHNDTGVRQVVEQPYTWPTFLTEDERRAGRRPVVVGAGCAGLFCALTLAEAGLKPLIVERGDHTERRTRQVAAFDAGAELDPESNIQFGLGGAGTISDGKLATGTKDRTHRLILDTFVAQGAPPDILWDAHPHVGSDVLPRVVHALAARIEQLGGELRCRCRMSGLEVVHTADGRRVQAITLTQTAQDGTCHNERLAVSDVVLACGHSARDVFELLRNTGIALERKTFAMGVRIEHLQETVDRALYGSFAGHPSLGAAPYKLVAHLPETLPRVGGRSAFSFCMCPGGSVVAAASEVGGVVTNGMSLAARNGINANAGLLANVFATDLPGDDALAGIELQRHCERAAFTQAGCTYAAPAQLVGDFLARRPSTGAGSVIPTYPRGVVWGSVEHCLPDFITETLRAAIPQMAHHLPGFDTGEAVLTGVETRSSSPVRITRGKNLQSISCLGLWPAGEGAGYAGGIMSAAADGIHIAEALMQARHTSSCETARMKCE